MADLLIQTIGIAFGAFFFIFWETEVGLNIWIVTLAYTIYAIWNAINDPLVGYIADRPKKFWSRYGKRFPWIMISAFPAILLIIAIFAPPNIDPVSGEWGLFIWIVFFLCLYELFVSIFSLNHAALFPDRFRLDADRRKVGTIGRALILVGLALGSIIPPLLVTYGDRQSYANMAWVIAGISVILFFTIIPGHIETKEMKDRYISEQDNKEMVSFLEALKIVLSSKNFLALNLVFLMDALIGVSLVASIQYLTKYILLEEAGTSIIFMAAFILGALGSIFFWLLLAQKIKNNRKMLIIGVFLNTIFLLPFMFVHGVMDEATVKTGHRIEGAFMGVRTFFLRLALVIQGLIFTITHILTGFDATSDVQTELAQFGILVHTALIPMILTLIALVIFILVYKLTPEKTKEIKEKLKELNL
jgi:GPH family glycoside/pentoside/hexuronide:cation symporter